MAITIGGGITIGNGISLGGGTISSSPAPASRGGNRVVFSGFSSYSGNQFYGAYSVDPYVSVILSTTVPTINLYLPRTASSSNSNVVMSVSAAYTGSSGAGNVVTTSDGGITWSQAASLPAFNPNPTSVAWADVAYGGNTWVVVAGLGNSSTQVAYSTNNGSSWTSANPLPSDVWYSVTYGNGKFIALASGNARSSTNGITWSTGPTKPPNFVGTGNRKPQYISSLGAWYSIDSAYYVANDSLSVAYSTNDCSSWTSANRNATGVSKFAEVVWTYGNGIFVVLQGGQTSSWTSTDGVTWTTNSSVFSSSNYSWAGIVWTGTDFVAWSTTFSTYVSSYWYSPDGATWTQITTVPSNPYGSGGFNVAALTTS
jgi:hypothetical protein